MSDVRYQRVTLLVPFDVMTELRPADWDWSMVTNREHAPIRVLHAGRAATADEQARVTAVAREA